MMTATLSFAALGPGDSFTFGWDPTTVATKTGPFTFTVGGKTLTLDKVKTTLVTLVKASGLVS